MNEPLISVVIPTYNCEHFIEETLESVINQTYRNLEIILVDDKSKDSTALKIENFLHKDHRIKLLKNEKNSGVSISRNRGIQEASGIYIALLDGDDLWVTDKIEQQLKLAQETKADIIYSSYSLIDEKGKDLGREFRVPRKTSLEDMLKKSVISCSTAMIKTDILKETLFSTDYYHEDYVLWLRLLKKGAVAYGVMNVLAYYRQIKGSRSNDKKKAALERWKIYRKEMNFSVVKSLKYFLAYGIEGIKKYYL